jgi:phage protein D
LLRPAYRLQIGTTTIDSVDGTAGASLAATVVSIRAELDMDVPASSLAVLLGNVDGLAVAEGDPIALDLGYASDGLSPVMEGAILAVESGVSTYRIDGLSPMAALLDLRLHQTYEKQTAGDIVSDLAGQAGLDVGQVEDGIDFAVYVVDDSKNAYEHARTLAEKCGFDLYLDVDNKLIFKSFEKTSADHTFEYGATILAVDVQRQEPAYRRVEVWGESPASSQGEDAASWLTKTPQDFMGQAGSGEPLLLVRDRSIRTKAAAEASAQARLRHVEREALAGSLTVLGAPQVKLGDAVEVKEMPDTGANGIYQVRRIEHRLSKATGFVTTIGWLGL